MSESPVDEHQSNGFIENAVREIEEQVRTERQAFENRYSLKFKGSDVAWAWLIIEATAHLNRHRIGQDG